MLSRGKELSNTLQVPLYKGFDFVEPPIGCSVTGRICLTNKGVWLLFAQRYMQITTLETLLKCFKKGQLIVKTDGLDAPLALYDKAPRD